MGTPKGHTRISPVNAPLHTVTPEALLSAAALHVYPGSGAAPKSGMSFVGRGAIYIITLTLI